MNHENIAKNIKQLRKMRGYTQFKLAEVSKLSPNQIAKVESGGIKNPKISTMIALAVALNVEVGDLLT